MPSIVLLIVDPRTVGNTDLYTCIRENFRKTFLRLFEGGHFYLQTARADLLRALGRDLGETLAGR